MKGFNIMKRFLCIHCKEDFDKLPKERPNECRSGYTHLFVRKTHIEQIMKKRKAEAKT